MCFGMWGFWRIMVGRMFVLLCRALSLFDLFIFSYILYCLIPLTPHPSCPAPPASRTALPHSYVSRVQEPRLLSTLFFYSPSNHGPYLLLLCLCLCLFLFLTPSLPFLLYPYRASRVDMMFCERRRRMERMVGRVWGTGDGDVRRKNMGMSLDPSFFYCIIYI